MGEDNINIERVLVDIRKELQILNTRFKIFLNDEEAKK